MTGHDDQARPIPVGSGHTGDPADGPHTPQSPATELIPAAAPAPPPRAVPPTAVLPVQPAGESPADPYADWYAAPGQPPDQGRPPGGEQPAWAGAQTAGAAAYPAAGPSAAYPPQQAYPQQQAYPPQTQQAAYPPGVAPGARVPGPPAGRAPAPARRRRRRLRRVLIGLLVLVLGVVGYLAYVPWSAWQNVERVDATPAQRPPAAKGKNYLLVGSDSREGLTEADAATLNADTETAGKRTDTIMLVHVSDRGNKPVVVSLPRDSYVPIPGHGSNKINAAYAFGGAKLLTQTVEQATGLPVDGYLEIGFAGFASVVDSLGGVQMCLDKPMKDTHSGLDVPAGCQTMDGRTALTYVRARYSDPRGDLGRAERQRQFLAAVTKQALSLETIASPSRYTSFARAASQGITVGTTTTLWDAVSVLRALRAVGGPDGVSMQVPVENPAYQTKNAGVAVKWHDAQARALFAALRADEPVSVPAG